MSLGGQQIENVIHIDGGVPSGYVVANLVGINNDLITWWGTHLAPILSEEVTLRSVRSTDLTTESGPVLETVPSVATAGEVNLPSLPNNVAVVMTHRTQKRGRSYRGRTYIPGLPSDDANSSTDIKLSDVTALIAAFVSLVSTFSGTGNKIGVLSRFAGGTARSTGVFTPWTSTDANTAFDSQRRRLLGRGN